MSSIIRISDAASLGLHALAFLVHHGTTYTSTKKIAHSLNASEAHLAKVMQQLEHHDFVSSKRGPNGGFFIKQAPHTITLLAIYEALEGKIKSTKCILGRDLCNECCPLGHVFQKYENEIVQQLGRTTLLDYANQSGLKDSKAMEDK